MPKIGGVNTNQISEKGRQICPNRFQGMDE
jgi:hypothetical protein